MSSKVMCPSNGSFVVGPMEPATKRLRPLDEKLAATSRASLAAAKLISCTLSCRSYSANTTRVAPNVLAEYDLQDKVHEINRSYSANTTRVAPNVSVSTTSQPTL